MAENQTPKVMCACTKGPCNGDCREEHLNRKRKHIDRCPAAYEEKPKRERRHRDDYDDDDYGDE